jgi:iron complex transport system substrate-binding protein
MLLALIVCSAQAGATSAPQRIVSLAPNVTEILFAIGAGGRVVGVTDFCDQPEEAKSRNRIGGMSNPSLEAVVSLEPDLVVMTTDGNPKEFERRLMNMGIRVYVETTRSLKRLPDAVKRLGAVAGASDGAEALARSMEDALSSFASEPPGRGRRTLFIIWPEPLMVAGPGTVVHDAMELLGLDNVAREAGTNYPKYSLEEAVRQAPEVIFIGRSMGKDMRGVSKKVLERLGEIPAVREGKVYFLGDGLYRLGPRVVEGIREMRETLR